MGGKALSFESTRMTPQEFVQIEREIRSYLVDRLRDSVFSVNYVKEKESFGDVDLVLHSKHKNEDLVDWLSTGPISASELVRNSDTWSFPYKEHQVDLVFAENPLQTARWMGYNDFSNLVGRVAHSMGFRFGPDGLRAPIFVGSEKLGEITLTDDFYEILSYLGYSIVGYFEGFETFGAMFEYVASSRYFNPNIFLFQNRDGKSRRRDAKRPTYNKFLKWVEILPATGWYEFGPKDQYLSKALTHFGKMSEYDNLINKWEARRNLKTKFNGALVSEWTGLKDQSLGVFMQQFRAKYTEEELLNKTVKEIEQLVLDDFS